VNEGSEADDPCGLNGNPIGEKAALLYDNIGETDGANCVEPDQSPVLLPRLVPVRPDDDLFRAFYYNPDIVFDELTRLTEMAPRLWFQG
jgi:hypothetical protein